MGLFWLRSPWEADAGEEEMRQQHEAESESSAKVSNWPLVVARCARVGACREEGVGRAPAQLTEQMPPTDATTSGIPSAQHPASPFLAQSPHPHVPSGNPPSLSVTHPAPAESPDCDAGLIGLTKVRVWSALRGRDGCWPYQTETALFQEPNTSVR